MDTIIGNIEISPGLTWTVPIVICYAKSFLEIQQWISRSLKDLINTIDEIGSSGIDFRSYDNNLDTSTPTGKLVFQIVGAVAEFEKDIIRERVVAGLTAARNKDKQLGRPPIPQTVYDKAVKMRSEGLSFRKI